MSVLRLTKMTPDIYSQESRDFQLLCRIYDCVINGIKWDGDSTIKSIDTHNCRSEMLELLQTKLGFFTTKSFTMDELRMALEAFPDLVKSKGSLKAILGAVNTFLHTLHISTPVEIWCTKEETTIGSHVLKDHTLIIGIQASISDTTLLKEIFRYILPTGYDFYIYYYSKVTPIDRYVLRDRANLLFISEEAENNIADEQYELLEYIKKEEGVAYPSSSTIGQVKLGTVNENFGIKTTYSMTTPSSTSSCALSKFYISTGSSKYLMPHYLYASSTYPLGLRYAFNGTYLGSGTVHTIDTTDNSIRTSSVNFLNDGIAYYYNETTGDEFTETINKTSFSYDGVLNLATATPTVESLTVYDVQVSYLDKVIYHFVPARSSSGTMGFYELINGFFIQSGPASGYWTAGPSKGYIVSPVVGQFDDIKIAPEGSRDYTTYTSDFLGVLSTNPSPTAPGASYVASVRMTTKEGYYCISTSGMSLARLRGCYTDLSLVQNPATNDVVIIDNPNNNNYYYNISSSSSTLGKYRGAYSSTSAVTNPTAKDIISIHKPTEIEWYVYNGSVWTQLHNVKYVRYLDAVNGTDTDTLYIVRDYLIYKRSSSSWGSVMSRFTPPVYFPVDWVNGGVSNEVIAQELEAQLNAADETEEEETE